MSYQLQSKLTESEIAVLLPEDVDHAAQQIKPYPGGFRGRGITICAGGFRYFTNAWILVRILRKFGCTLPIQFWHWGPEEIDERMRQLVKPFGVECVDAQQVAREVGRTFSQGWPLKPFSILYSPFEEVLALDADNIPIRNPEYLFEDPSFLATGAVFWPDVGRTEPERAIWNLMEVPYRDEPEFESGQVLVNKALCWEPLNLAMWMNEEGRADFFYKIIWGDKDTFRFAWHKFGFPFAMTPVPLQMLTVQDGPCCTGVMCQHDLQGERIFQHRNMLKWNLFGVNPFIPGFLFEGDCRKFLAELRKVWNGRIGESARPRKGDGELADKLIGNVWIIEPVATVTPIEPTPIELLRKQRELLLQQESTTPGNTDAPAPHDPWPRGRNKEIQEIRFHKDGHLGLWSDSNLVFWNLDYAAERPRLTIGDDPFGRRPAMELYQEGDGSWAGRKYYGPSAHLLRMSRLQDVYPGSAEPAPWNEVRIDAQKKPGKEALHVFNSAHGIGDHIHSVYACAGAAQAGCQVVFHTRYPEWLERVRQPNLTISGEFPAELPPEQLIDLNYDRSAHIRYGRDAASWYAQALRQEVRPAAPASVDRSVRLARFDFDNYVAIFPFSAWLSRDWPLFSWTRLAHLLRESGYEVIALGTSEDRARFEAAFNQTTVMWAIDHPADWVTDVILGARCVIGNDSGMIHLAALLGVPTLCLHSQLPQDYLFPTSSAHSMTPKVSCVFCRWQPDLGYTTACDAACSALATISAEDVLKKVESIIESQNP